LVLFSLAVIPPVYTADALHAAAQVPALDPDDPEEEPDDPEEPDEDPDPVEPDPEDPDDPELLPDTSAQSVVVVGFQPVPV
jgi:hypothetical protein